MIQKPSVTAGTLLSISVTSDRVDAVVIVGAQSFGLKIATLPPVHPKVTPLASRDFIVMAP